MYNHLRNGIVNHYKKSPEQLINERAGANPNDIGFDPATMALITAGLTALIGAVPSIINSISKKDTPSTSDYEPKDNTKVDDPAGNNPNNGGKPADDPKPPFYKSTLGKIIIIGVPTLAVGGAAYYYSTKSKKNK